MHQTTPIAPERSESSREADGDKGGIDRQIPIRVGIAILPSECKIQRRRRTQTNVAADNEPFLAEGIRCLIGERSGTRGVRKIVAENQIADLRSGPQIDFARFNQVDIE